LKIYNFCLTLKNLKNLDKIDQSLSSFFIEVITSFAKNNLEMILSEKKLEMIEIIAVLTQKCPTYKIFTIVEFFSDFNDYLASFNYTEEDIMNTFKNIYMLYLNNVISLTIYDTKIFDELNNSNLESLNNNETFNSVNDYRNAANDIFEDFLRYYSYDMLIEELIFPKINKITKRLSKNDCDISSWCNLENYLFIFFCVVKNIEFIDETKKSSKNILIIFKTLFDIEQKYLQILRTICDIINHCSKLFNAEKELITLAYDFLKKGLNNKLSLQYCSIGLRNK